MALQLNQISREGWALNQLSGIQRYFSSTGGNSRLNVYTTAVAYPNAPVNAGVTPPIGQAVAFNNILFTRSGASLILSGTTSVNATLNGTLSWWALSINSVYGYLLSDSIGISGSGAILTVGSMTATSGSAVTISFALTAV